MEEPKKFGRPTEYKPEYCQKLIDYMALGYSYEAFAGKLGVSKQTLYNWEKANQDFMDAKSIAVEKCRVYWESLAIDNPFTTKLGGLNTGVWVFNMKNRFKWTDKVEVEAGEETRNVLKLAYNLEEEK